MSDTEQQEEDRPQETLHSSSRTERGVPVGFKSIDITQLLPAKGTATADKELWVIRVPASFDLNSLKDHKISLTESRDIKTATGSYKIAKASDQSETHNLAVFLADDNGTSLKFGKPVTGQLNVTKAVSVPIPIAPIVKPNIIKQPAGLNHVFVPFGAAIPVASNDGFKKPKKLVAKTEDSEDRKRKSSKQVEEAGAAAVTPDKSTKTKHKKLK